MVQSATHSALKCVLCKRESLIIPTEQQCGPQGEQTPQAKCLERTPRVNSQSDSKSQNSPRKTKLNWVVQSPTGSNASGVTTSNGKGPLYRKEHIVPYYSSRSLRSQNAGLLVVLRISKMSLGGRALSYQAPLLWNQLQVHVREADTLSTFKSRLKTFLWYSL